jgi:hypothetical protein
MPGRHATQQLEGAYGRTDALCAYAARRHRHRCGSEVPNEHGLAIDVDGELATRDGALIRAARVEGVPLALE